MSKSIAEMEAEVSEVRNIGEECKAILEAATDYIEGVSSFAGLIKEFDDKSLSEQMLHSDKNLECARQLIYALSRSVNILLENAVLLTSEL